MKGHASQLLVLLSLAWMFPVTGPAQGRDEVPEEVTALREHAAQRFQNARFAAQAEKYDLATEEYEAVVESFLAVFAMGHGEPREYLLTAELQGLLERPEEAMALLEKGQKKFPEDPMLAMSLADGLSATGRFKEAYQKYRAIDEKWGSEPAEVIDDRFYFSYGAAAERIGKSDEAEMLFRLSIQLAPRREEPYRAARAMNYLGYMWLERGGDLEQSGLLIKQANELVPDDPAFVDSLGWYHFKAGDYKEALRQLLRVEEMAELSSPEDAVILDHIGQAYFQLGHKDKAIEYLEEAVAMDSESDEAEDYRERLKEFRTAGVPAEVPLDFLDEEKDGEGDKAEPGESL